MRRGREGGGGGSGGGWLLKLNCDPSRVGHLLSFLSLNLTPTLRLWLRWLGPAGAWGPLTFALFDAAQSTVVCCWWWWPGIYATIERARSTPRVPILTIFRTKEMCLRKGESLNHTPLKNVLSLRMVAPPPMFFHSVVSLYYVSRSCQRLGTTSTYVQSG